MVGLFSSGTDRIIQQSLAWFLNSETATIVQQWDWNDCSIIIHTIVQLSFIVIFTD